MQPDFYVHYNYEYAVLFMPQEVIISNSGQFKEKLQALMDEGYQTVYLDCSKLKMFDTTAIISVGALNKRFEELGGGLKFINVESDYIKSMFETIQLHKIVEIEYSGDCRSYE